GRRIVAVDQVVRYARMIGILDELFLQDRSGFQVGRKGLLRLGLGAGDVERAENLRFVVIRVAGGQFLKRPGARLLARSFRAGRKILVVGGDGFDVVAL